MVLWLNLLLLAAVVFAEPSKCPVGCDCTEINQAVCTTLDIEPFPTNEITTLRLKDVAKPIELSGKLLQTLRLTNLRRLFIVGSTVKRMDPSTFNSTQIDQLVIRHSLIKKIENKLFRHSKHIRQIDLSYSKIEHFEGIESPIVDEIVLDDCNLHEIPENALSRLDALSFLSLADNKISSINISQIAGEQIILSNNLISTLKIEASDDTPLSLKLNNNPLKTIEITENTDIEELHLKGCQLTNLDFLKYFQELTHLDVSYNQIAEIPEATFSHLYSYGLQTLNLAGNHLRTVPANLMRLTSLTTLNLDFNDLHSLPVFAMNSALDLFSCNNCNLQTIDKDVFRYMHMTKQVFLANNHLKELPQEIFKPIVSLRSVDLSNNSLTSLPDKLFAYNTDIKSVSLKKNPLKEIDAVLFEKTKMIHTIDVSNCELNKLWTLKSNVTLPSLKELNAMNNSITSVRIKELLVAPKLEVLNLQNNKLVCTDATSDMIDWLDDNNVKFIHSSKCTGAQYSDYSEYDNSLDYDKVEDLQFQKEENLDKPGIENNISDEDDDDDDDDDVEVDDDTDEESKREEFVRDAGYVQGVEFSNFDRERSNKEMLLFLLPTLVFVLTALVVLLLTVSVVLCVLQKRNGRRTNAPQIIVPWATGMKVKKHSGSIYRPLSEEKIPV